MQGVNPLQADDMTLDTRFGTLLELYQRDSSDPAVRAELEKCALRLLERPSVGSAVLEAAESLSGVRASAVRVLPLLADAYRRLGRTADEISALTREHRLSRPPRLFECQSRLAQLRHEVLDDTEGALELLEPLLARDLGDDNVRKLYLELSLRAGRADGAARFVERALRTLKDPGARLRAGRELADLQLDLGEVPKAIRELGRVVTLPLPAAAADRQAVMSGAQRVLELASEHSVSAKLLATSHAVVLETTGDEGLRRESARQLGELVEQHADLPDAVQRVAFRSLARDRVPGALERFEALVKTSNDPLASAEALELRAEHESDPAVALELRLQSAELRCSVSDDPNHCCEVWQRHVEAHGPSAGACDRLLPLLERTDRIDAALELLARRQASETDPEVAAELWAHSGSLLLERKADPSAAIDAFAQSLALHPEQARSRVALLSLLKAGEHRGQAASVLEPHLRAADDAMLIDLLDVKLELAVDPEGRLARARELVQELERRSQPAERIVQAYVAAIVPMAALDPDALGAWLERLEAHRPSVDANRYAELLGAAASTLEGDAGATVARVAGAALAQTGQHARALPLFERALAVDPGSLPLLEAADRLLETLGEPLEGRLERLDKALPHAKTPEARADLLGLQARVLTTGGDAESAIEMLSGLVEAHPGSQQVHQALVAAYQQLGDSGALYDELERAIAGFEGPARDQARLRMAQALADNGETGEALRRYGELLDQLQLDPGVLDGIEALAEEVGDPEVTCKVLEQRIAHASDPQLKVELLERLGVLRMERLGDDAGAVRSWRAAARLSEQAPASKGRAERLYERMIATAPEDHLAAERLVRLYVEAGEWSRIPEVFAVILQAGAAGSQTSVELLLSLEGQAVRSGAIDELCNLIDEAVWQLSGQQPELARSLIAAKARALASDPGRIDAAVEVYRNLVESYAHADDVAALANLAEAHPSADHRRDLLRWLFAWRELHADDKARLLLEWAEVEQRDFGDVEAAIQAYERALGHGGAEREVLDKLAGLKLQIGDIEGGVQALGALRELCTEPARTEIDLRMAGLLSDALEQHAVAFDLVAPYLQARPPNPQALRIAVRCVEDAEVRSRAAEAIEAIASETSNAELLAVLVTASEADPAAFPRARDWYARLLSLRGEQPAAALEIAARAAAAYPDDERFWTAAIDGARALERPDPIAAGFCAALETELDPELGERLGRRVVEFLEEWPAGADLLVPVLERMIERSIGADWAFARLRLLLGSRERYPQLFDLYERRITEAPDDEARAALLDEAALTAKDLAGDPERAIRYLEELLSLRPSDRRVEGTLERLYERQGRLRELAQLLERRAAAAEGADRHDLLARSCRATMDLGELAEALATIERLERENAAEELLIALYDRLLSGAPQADPSPADAEVSLRASEALFQLHFHAGRKHEAASARQRALPFVIDASERAHRLNELASFRLEQLDDPAGAFDNICDLTLLQPEVTEHRHRLQELARRLSRNANRVQVLVQAAEQARPILAAELVDEAARACVELLDDEERAIELYVRALPSAEGDPAALEILLTPLAELLHDTERHEEECDALERLAAAQMDASARSKTLARVAQRAFEVLSDPPRAARAWQALLEEHPDDRQALDGRVQALQAADDVEGLLGALLERAERVDRAGALDDHLSVARLLTDRLGRPEEAIDAWLRVRSEFGRDEESFAALKTLFETSDSWQRLAELFEDQIEHAADAERRRQLQRALAAVCEERLNDPQRALQALVAAGEWPDTIELCKRHPQLDGTLVKQSVAVWKQERGSPKSGPAATALWACQACVERLRAAEQYERALGLLERFVAFPFETAARRRMSLDAAALCAGQLARPDRAAALLQELVAADGQDEIALAAYPLLARALTELGQAPELAHALEAHAGACEAGGDTDQARSLFEQAAALRESLDDAPAALAAHRRAADHGSTSSLAALARLHRGRGEHHEAAAALESLYAASPIEARADVAVELARQLRVIDQGDLARARLGEVRAAGHATPELRELLVELYREGERWQPLAELLSARADEDALSPADRIASLSEAADIYAGRLDAPLEAAPLLERALELDPQNLELEQRLALALSRAGRHAEALGILRARLELYGERRPRERADVHRQLAQALLSAGDANAALEELKLAADVNPGHAGIVYELARLARDLGDLALAEQSYRTLLLVVPHQEAVDRAAPERPEIYLHLSDLATQQQDPDRAAELLESAFDAALEGDEQARALAKSLADRDQPALLRRALLAHLEQTQDAASKLASLADLVTLAAASGEADLLERCQQVAETLFSTLDELDLTRKASLAGIYQRLATPASVERALSIHEHLFERRPEDHEVRRRLFEVFVGAGELERLRECVERVAAQCGDPVRAGTLRLEAARCLLAEDALSEAAVGLLEQVVQQTPEQHEALPLLAELLQRLGRQAAVLDLLRNEMELAERRGDAARAVTAGLELAELLERQEQPAEALRVCRRVVETDPTHRPALAQLLRLCDAQGVAAEELLDVLERLLQLESGQGAAELSLRLAQLYGERAEDAKRRAALERGFSACPEHADVREQLIDAHSSLPSLVPLCDLFDRALAERPDDRRLRRELAEIYARAGNLERALALVDDELAAAPQKPALHARRSQLLEGLGRQAEAVAALERAHALDPRYAEPLIEALTAQLADQDRGDDPRLRLRLAELAAGTGDVGAAREQLSRLLEAASLPMDLLERLAVALEGLGDLGAACGARRRLMDQGAPLGPQALAIARLCERLGEPGRALAELERAYAADPSSTEVGDRLLELYDARGERQKLADLLLCQAEATEGPERLTLLGRAAEQLLGDDRTAAQGRALLEQVCEEQPGNLQAALLLAESDRARGQRAPAREVLGRAIGASPGRRSPELARAYALLGRLHLEDDELAEAYEALTRAFEMNKTESEIALLLGLLAFDLDQLSVANRTLRTVIMMKTSEQKAPGCARARDKATAYYQLAYLAHLQRDAGKARLMLNKALYEDPQHARAQQLLSALSG